MSTNTPCVRIGTHASLLAIWRNIMCGLQTERYLLHDVHDPQAERHNRAVVWPAYAASKSASRTCCILGMHEHLMIGFLVYLTHVALALCHIMNL